MLPIIVHKAFIYLDINLFLNLADVEDNIDNSLNKKSNERILTKIIVFKYNVLRESGESDKDY